MFLKIVLSVCFSVELLCSLGAYAAYPYASVCPNGDDVEGGYWYDGTGSYDFYVDRYGFAQCNCTSYVAYKVNEMLENHSPTDPMFTNSYHNLASGEGFKWSHAYHWEDAIGTAVPGHFSRYPETLLPSNPSYPWKTASDGTIYDVRFAIAWWNREDPNDQSDKGHVAWVESVGSDGKTVTMSEYNWDTVNGYGTRTLSPGQSGYPDGFLYIFTDSLWECDLTGLCDSGSGGPGGGGGSPTQTNLKLDFDIMHSDGHELYAGQDVLGPPLQVKLRAQVEAENGNAADWADAGKDKIELDYYVQYGSNREWARIYRGYLTINKLTEGTTLQETYTYTIPAGLSVNTVSFKLVIDAEDEVNESNESDNVSRIEIFTYDPNAFSGCNLTISNIGLDDGKTELVFGERYGLRAAIRNIGTTQCPNGTRMTYYEKRPGQGSFTAVADDGSDQGELAPGIDQWEHTMSQPFTASVVGLTEVMGCADTNGANPETNETDNCLTDSFVVAPVGPDFVVSALWLAEGTNIKKGTRVHPYCTVQNIGNISTHHGFRLAYYINADQYRDSDGIDPNEVCAGCFKTEYVSNNKIKLGNKGTRTYRCCVDYQGAVTELNESNNCATIRFTVR